MNQPRLNGLRLPVALKPGLLYSHNLASAVRKSGGMPSACGYHWAALDDAGPLPPTPPFVRRMALAALLVLALAAAAVLSGCGGSSDAEDPAQPDRNTQPTGCTTHPEKCQ